MSTENATRISSKKSIIAGLDIGTTKVVCVVGSINQENKVEVIGVGHAETLGMRQGVVVNIEAVTEAIQKAKDEAELMSGVQVKEVWLSVGGAHIKSFASNGMIAIRDKEVTKEDIERVIEAAKAVAIPNDREVLHVLPNDYKIDGQEGISDPIGMAGVRLETSVHIVTGGRAAIQNALKCAENTGLKVSGVVLEQLASSLAVISDDEKSLGVSVIDIGGGNCDMISYVQGSVVHTAVIPVGGNNFTHDAAMGLRTTQQDAEDLKKKFGSALPDNINENETIDVSSVGNNSKRTISRKELCTILEARADETLQLVRGELQDAGLLSKMGSGIVLTGGGSQLSGLAEIGDFNFEIPVRRGLPSYVGGLTDVVKDASFATSVGLLLYGLSQTKKIKKTKVRNSENNFGEKLSNWFHQAKNALTGM